jgi:DNA polymerase-1
MSPFQFGRIFREAVNATIQGSVADLINKAMIDLYLCWVNKNVLYDAYANCGKAKIISQTHDDLILEVREDFLNEAIADVKRSIREAINLKVPIKMQLGCGLNWLEAKNV